MNEKVNKEKEVSFQNEMELITDQIEIMAYLHDNKEILDRMYKEDFIGSLKKFGDDNELEIDSEKNFTGTSFFINDTLNLLQFNKKMEFTVVKCNKMHKERFIDITISYCMSNGNNPFSPDSRVMIASLKRALQMGNEVNNECTMQITEDMRNNLQNKFGFKF